MTSVAHAAPSRRAGVRSADRFIARRLPTALWLALWAAVAAVEAAALIPLVDGGYTALPAVYVVMRLVGGSFAVCGLIAWRRRPDNRSGPLMTATGFGFFVTPLLSQIDSPVTLTLAYWLPDIWLVFFVTVLLTLLTGGRLRTRLDRVIVAVVAVGVVPLRLLFHDVERNLLLVRPDARLAITMGTVQRALLVCAILATAGVVAARFHAARPAGRRALLPSVAGAASLLLWLPLLVRDYLREYRFVLTSQAIDWVVAISVVVVPLVFLAGLLRSRLARGGLADLFRTLRELQPAQLQAALGRAVGDPGLVLAYRRPDSSLRDVDGTTVTLPEPDDGRSVAWVERDGRPVAALIYDTSLDDDPELVEAAQAAAAVAMENRDLHAEVRTQLAELRESRERIIAAGDAERRRIERNLHDGAQQRLVLLAMQLSAIQRQIRADPAGAEELVTSAGTELARSLAELRELARGLHPAALDHGLDVALEALTTSAAVPATLQVEPGPRMPEPVALAAYFVVSEALTNVAKYARATHATVSVTRPHGQVLVEIADDGIGGADPASGSGLRGLTDRVEALGGTLRVADRPGGGTLVTARLPLAA